MKMGVLGLHLHINRQTSGESATLLRGAGNRSCCDEWSKYVISAYRHKGGFDSQALVSFKKYMPPSFSLLQGKHLPFTPSPLRLNIFRLFVILSLTQLYRYTPEIFLFSTAIFKYKYRAPWVMARYLSSYLEQELPGLAGFWSVLVDEPPILTIIDYYPVINQPITDNKAVQECLRYSEQGAREVGQKYVVTTLI